ncbi:MAG: hypothetical protein E7076_08435, partial [Bacteroidales bacterium]|nr:hypothetical protein [Bacteroidales bacterium]
MKHTFKPLLWAFSCLLSLSPFLGAQAQTPCSDRVMRDITFQNQNDPSATKWTMDETGISSYDFTFDTNAYSYSETFNSVKTPQGGNNNTTRQYAVVKNPHDLNPQFANINTDGMLVINPLQNESDNYFTINVGGLIAGQTYYIEMKLYNVVSLDCPGMNCGGGWSNFDNAFRVDGNNTIFNCNNTGDKGAATNLKWTNNRGDNNSGDWNCYGNPIYNAFCPSTTGTAVTMTGEVRVPDGCYDFKITFNKPGSTENQPMVLGIDYIRIKGCEEEKIQTSTGTSKVCEYDPIKLTAMGIGSANGTYTWYKNGAVIAGATTKTITVDAPGAGQTATYRAVGEYNNKEITLTGATCCGSGDKVMVFNETFPLTGSTGCGGQFYDLPAGGEVGPKYSWAGNHCDNCDTRCAGYQYAVGGAQYAVVDRLNKGGWWPCWDNANSQPVSGSHTNDGSGFLLVNANPDGGSEADYFYKRTLTNVCPGTTYEFSAYAASIQNGAGEGGAKIRFKIYENGNLIEQSEDISLGNLSGWVQTKVLFTTTNAGSTYDVRIVNTQTGNAGNDLAIDDITVSKCLLKVNVFDDEGNTDLEVCSTNPVRITATMPGNGDLATKLGSTPYYLWQRSTNGTNWTDIGSATTNAYYDATPTATKTYYRAKIGSQGTINQPITASECRADTYSEIFSLVKNGNLNVTATAAPDAICAGAQLKVNGSVTGATNPTYSWKYSANGNWDNATDLAGTAQTFTKNNATTADDGTYYFVVTDNGCEAHASAAVEVKAKPNAPQVTNATPACPGGSMTFQASGVANATYTWTGSVTGNGDTKTVNNVTSGQTYSGTVKATVSGCDSDAANYTATAKTKPNAPQVTNATPACPGGSMTFQASGVANATYTWTGSVTGNGDTKTVNNVTSGQTYSGTVKATVAGCDSDAANYTATAKTKPNAPQVTNATPACPGESMTFQASGVAGATYTWTGSVTGNGDTKTVNNVTGGQTYSGTVKATVSDCESDAANYTATAKTTPTLNVTNATPVCAGGTMTFQATPTPNTATVTWTGSVNGTGTSKDVTNVTSGQTYTGTVKATLDGCESATANYEATAKTTPTIEVRNLQCSADLLTYTGEVVVSAGTPSVVSGVGASITGMTFKGDKDQNAVVKVTADGCSSDDYDVTAPNCDCDPIDAPVDASAAHEYCSDKTVPTLSVTANLGANEQVEWFESADCSGTAISTNKDFTPSATQVPAAGNSKSYYVRVRNTTTNCKSDVTTVTLKNNQAPTVVVVPAAAVCEPGTIDITTTASGANTYKYYSDATATTEMPSTTVSATTDYWVVGTSAEGCV